MGVQKLEINYEGKKFTISFKGSSSKEVRVVDEENREHYKMAKRILRFEVKRLKISSNGYLYNGSGEELITNEYFNMVYNFKNKK